MSKEKEETKTKKKATTKTKVAAAKETAQKEIDNKTLLKEIANLVESEESPSVFELTGTEEEPINLEDITEVGFYILKGKVDLYIEEVEEYKYSESDAYFMFVTKANVDEDGNGNINQSLLWGYDNYTLLATRDGAYDGYQKTASYNNFINAIELRIGNLNSYGDGGLINTETIRNILGNLVTHFTRENNPLSTLNDLQTNDKSSLVNAINEIYQNSGSGLVKELTGTEENPIDLNEITKPGIYILNGNNNLQVDNLEENEYKIGDGTFILSVFWEKNEGVEIGFPVYQTIFWVDNLTPLLATRFGTYYSETEIPFGFAFNAIKLRNGNYEMPSRGGFINSQEFSKALSELITTIVPNGSYEELPLSTLANLQTNDKTSLVNAINEVNNKINDINNGGEVTPTNSMYKELIGTDDNPINIDNVIENGMYILTGTITSTWDEQILEQLHENSENYMFVSKYFDEEKTSEMITQNLLYWNKKESCLGVLSRICSVADYEAGRLNQWINKNLALNPKEYIDMEEGIVSNTDLRGMASQLITEMYIDKNNNQYSVPVSTLKDLQTDDKSSLVNAINEINKKLNDMNGGGVPSNSAFHYLVGTPENPINLDDIIEPGMYVIKGSIVPIESLSYDYSFIKSFTIYLFVIEHVDNNNDRTVCQTVLHFINGIPAVSFRTKNFPYLIPEDSFTLFSEPVFLKIGNYTELGEGGLISPITLFDALNGLVTRFVNNGFNNYNPISRLENLETENKESLVNAINEINQKVNNMSGGVIPSGNFYNELTGTPENPVNLDYISEPGLYIIKGNIAPENVLPTTAGNIDTYLLFVTIQQDSDGSTVTYQSLLFVEQNIPSYVYRTKHNTVDGLPEGFNTFSIPINLEFPSRLQQGNTLVNSNNLFYVVSEFITKFMSEGDNIEVPISKLVNLETENKESLVNAINELKGEIDTLKAEIETLKSGE